MDDVLIRLLAAFERTDELAALEGESGLSADVISFAELGYFVLIFSVLEIRIDRCFEQRVGDPAAWPFMRRARMIFDGREGVSRGDKAVEWVGDRYAVRCDIAHGDWMKFKPLDIRDFVTEVSRVIDFIP